MPQHTTVHVPAGSWKELTSADITDITFQNTGSNYVLIQATVGSVEPTSKGGALRYNPGQGERKAAIADLFPGVAGANRVWAYAESISSVTASHA